VSTVPKDLSTVSKDVAIVPKDVDDSQGLKDPLDILRDQIKGFEKKIGFHDSQGLKDPLDIQMHELQDQIKVVEKKIEISNLKNRLKELKLHLEHN